MNRWSKSNLIDIVIGSKTQKEVLEKLGLRSAGGNSKTLKKYIEKYDIDTSHFIKKYDKMVSLNILNKKSLKEILVENSDYQRHHLKKRLYDTGLKQKKCELCGQGEEWNGMKISLILDHINGIYNDNRIENLRIVCPNCNAGLDTHCGKNININNNNINNYCKCGVKISKKSSFCIKCLGKLNRKVERPPYEELLKEVDEFGYSATGRKYGVSDNAVRKWIKDEKV